MVFIVYVLFKESAVGLPVEPLKHDGALFGSRPRVGKRSVQLCNLDIRFSHAFPHGGVGSKSYILLRVK